MKTGNDLVAEQARYSTRVCCLPNYAKQRNFVVSQRIAVCLPYSSFGCIDSFLSLHRTRLCGLEVIPATPYPADADKLCRALYDDLMKRADNKEAPSEKDSTGKAFADYHHIVCFYDDFSEEIGQVRTSGVSYTNICKMI